MAVSGVSEPHQEDLIKACPNVFTSTTTLQIRSAYASVSTIELYNTGGQLLQSFTVETPNADVVLGSQLTAGVYYARLIQGNTQKAILLTKTQ